MKKLIIALIYLLSVVPCIAENTPNNHNNRDYANSESAQGPAGSKLTRYVPNQIIVKFRRNVADTIETRLAKGETVEKIGLSSTLDKLHKKYRVTETKPVFKNFKKQRQRIRTLLKKDKALLTKREKRMLRRLRRAPRGAKVPDLDRIYKLEVELEPGQSLEEVVAAYNGDPCVEYTELNYIVSICTTPNDSYYPMQWPLDNTGQSYPVSGGSSSSGTADCDVDAPEAWEIHTGSSDVIVAVLDTGVDYTHRDIQANMWMDSNGYYGYDFFNDDNDPTDDNGHGTHCAGIIAADGNNGVDIAGVCWNTKIMALKFMDRYGYGFGFDALEAIYYAVENGADVISNSWGGGNYLQSEQDTIDYAYSQGVIMVAAAGNDNIDSEHYPAAYDHVISVAATDSDDQKASFSNYGDWVDIAAPGVDILSLRASNTDMYLGASGYIPGDRFVPYGDRLATLYIASGTSMACPHVSGASALLLSLNPVLTSDEACDILTENIDPISLGICISNGRLNLHKALLASMSSKGIPALDNSSYSCSSTISIWLADKDIACQNSQAVTLTTNGGDLETVILDENAGVNGIFEGTISTTSGGINVEDGMLQVAHDQIIIVTYEDANDGTGNPATTTDTSEVDCQLPAISNVQFNSIGPAATITFETNEPTTNRVLCGLVCGEPYIMDEINASLSINHTITLNNLSPETNYFFIIKATDVAGNETTDSNDGQCYTFTTDSAGDIRVPGDYITIQEAINNCWEGYTIWVADGTYTGEGNHDIDFKGRAITVKSENGPENCIIDVQADYLETHRGFYFHSYESELSVLEGFTIMNGIAPNEYDGGGGIKCVESMPTIINCRFINNTAGYYGGGIYNMYSNPKIINCQFSQNVTGVWPNDFFGGGAGIANYSSSPIISECVFVENAGISGGGMYNELSNPAIINCAFVRNETFVHDGGGIWNSFSDLSLTNCTFTGNTANKGAGIFCVDSSDLTMTNCIMWGDQAFESGNEIFLSAAWVGGPSTATISYSNIQGGLSGVYVEGDSTLNWEMGNVNIDPCFVDIVNSDYHLQSVAGRWDPNVDIWVADTNTSSCIDAGDPTSDWTAELWPHGKRINMGAFGGTPQASMSLSDAGNIADLNNNGSVNYTDLMMFSNQWLYQEILISEDLNRNGFVNFLDFAIFANNWLWQE